MKQKTVRLDELENAIRKKETFVRNVLLLESCFTHKDLIEKGIATSRQSASSQIKWFVERGIILKKGNIYRLEPSAFDKISDLLPPRNVSEKIKRRLVKDFDIDSFLRWRQDDSQPRRESKKKSGLQPPGGSFDIKAIMHPALVVDSNLFIHDYSSSFEKMISNIRPDFSQNVSEKKLQFIDFLENV